MSGYKFNECLKSLKIMGDLGKTISLTNKSYPLIYKAYKLLYPFGNLTLNISSVGFILGINNPTDPKN